MRERIHTRPAVVGSRSVSIRSFVCLARVRAHVVIEPQPASAVVAVVARRINQVIPLLDYCTLVVIEPQPDLK